MPTGLCIKTYKCYDGSSITFAAANTGIAQLVEHRSPKPSVGSSSLSSRAGIRSCSHAGYGFFVFMAQEDCQEVLLNTMAAI